MKDKMINFFMGVAEQCASMSRARRLQVGAVITNEDNIISFSWNGTPAGWDNTCEDKEYMRSDAGAWLDPEEIYKRWPFEETVIVANDNESFEIPQRYQLKTKPEVLHAEMNSLMKLAKSSSSGNQASLFVTHSPCLDCAKGIYQAGIKEVYYRKNYRNDAGIKFLEKSGVTVTQV